MRKNWPYYLVASLLNAVLITGAFIEFKLRGMAAPGLPVAPQPAWLPINPFAFSGCIFILSFLLVIAVTGIGNLVASMFTPRPPKGGVQLHATRFKLHANQ